MSNTEKRVQLNLKLRSEACDALCGNGEVERYLRVDWLDDAAAAEGGSSTGGNAKGEAVVRYATSMTSAVSGLGEGVRLLAIHDALHKGVQGAKILVMGPDRMIRSVDMPGRVSREVTVSPVKFGTLLQAIPYGDVVTLVCSGGVCWLLYDAAADTYSFAISLPEAPQVSFSLTPAYLAGYTRMAGSRPEMEVGVDLSDVEGVTSEALSTWLDTGSSSRVPEIVVSRTYEAVALRIKQYMRDVRDAGLTATPVRCVAAFGGFLPSQCEVPASGYASPYARLSAWRWEASSLRLTIAFSLLPLQLAASFSVSTLQRRWREHFGELSLYVSSSARWCVGAVSDSADAADQLPRVSGYTSLASADGGGFAFRFHARDASRIGEAVAGLSDFRKAGSVAIDASAASGIVSISIPAPEAEIFTPDYNDHRTPQAEGAVLTDEGVVMWCGSELYAPHPGSGVIYRRGTVVSDSRLLAVTQGYSSRSTKTTGRQTLLGFSADGVRELMADSSGEYVVKRLLSRDVLTAVNGSGSQVGAPWRRVAVMADGVAFLTAHGVRVMSRSGTVTTVLTTPPAADVALTDIRNMVYDESSGLTLCLAADALLAFDAEGTVWCEAAEDDWVDGRCIATGGLYGYEGMVYCADDKGRIVQIECRSVSIATDGDSSSGIPPQLDPSQSMIVLRPLKLAGCLGRSRIRSVAAPIAGVAVRISGSDNLQDWQDHAEVSLPVKGLHLPATRYHRLILTLSADSVGQLRTLVLSYVEK